MAAPSKKAASGERTRYHALDSLRAWAMLLGLALHAAIPYATGCQDSWPVCDDRSSVVFDYAIALIHAFRMPVFFVMAGFFGLLLLERAGAWGFVKHRLVRIVIPLLVAWMTIGPATRAVWIYGAARAPDSGVEASWGYVWAQLRSEGLEVFALAWHLWFLEYLLIYYAIALVATWLGRLIGAGRLLGKIDGLIRWIARSAFGPLVLAIPVGAASLLMREGYGADGIKGAIPEPRMVLYYGVFFVFGWLLWRCRDVVPTMGRWWLEQTAVGALFMFPTVMYLWQRHMEVGEDWTGWAAKGASGVMTCLLTLGVIGMFVRLLPDRRRPVRYLADASYWLYLVHFPLVVWLTIMLAPVGVSAFAKFGIALGASVAVLIVSYQTLVRYTWIGLVLNGRRVRGSARS